MRVTTVAMFPIIAIFEIIRAVILDSIDVGLYSYRQLSKLWLSYLRARDPLLRCCDVTLRLAEVCIAGNYELAASILKNHRDSIDIHAFLDIVCRCSNTNEERNEAMKLALGKFRTSIDEPTINRAFITACEFRSVSIIPIFSTFFYRLSNETIEIALILCLRYTQKICLRIIKSRAERGRDPRMNMQLTVRSLAIGFKLCYRRGSRAAKILELMDVHYARLQGVKCGKGHKCRCGRHRQRLQECGIHGQIDMVQAILIEEPMWAGRFLDQGVDGNSPGVVMLVYDGYRELLEITDITRAMDSALFHAFPFMTDMLIDLFPDAYTEDTYVKIFNNRCECDMHDSVKLILAKCKQSGQSAPTHGRHMLLFEHGFTFNPEKVKTGKKTLNILYAAYGNQLREQFPDWEYED